MQLYKLITPDNAKFRIGKTGWYDTDEMIHSDTLCNAIIANCAKLYGSEKARDLQNAYKAGKIKHSSLFYLLDFEKDGKVEKTIHFFPKPIGILPPFKTNKNNKSKVLSAKWVSEKLFKEISDKFNRDFERLGEQKIEIEEAVLKKHKDKEKDFFVVNLKKDEILNIDNKFLLYKNELPEGIKEIPPFLSIQTESKNKIDRRTGQVAKDENGKGQLFTEIDVILNQVKADGFIIKPHCYFLADVTEMQQEFDASLRLLCDEGLGGERAFGRGRFDGFENIRNKAIDLMQNRICLSLINPKADELDHIQFYDSVIRGGYTGGMKRKNVRMITEGSFFKERIEGQMPNVTPGNWSSNYQVFQNGNAFFGN